MQQSKSTIAKNIRAAELAVLKKQWWLWVPLWLIVVTIIALEVSASSGESSFGIFLAFVLFGVMMWRVQHVRGDFWKAFALEHGLVYNKRGSTDDEKGLIFNQKDHAAFTSYSHIYHLLTGTHRGRLMRMFELTFTQKIGKHEKKYWFTVFELTMKGTFPHIYLNYKHDGYVAKMKGNVTKIPLPGDVANQYTLYAPHQYEIEALEIFTQSIFQFLLDGQFSLDVEIIDGEVIFYRHKRVNSREELEEAFTHAAALFEKIAARLDRSKLYTIGDHPHEITQ